MGYHVIDPASLDPTPDGDHRVSAGRCFVGAPAVDDVHAYES